MGNKASLSIVLDRNGKRLRAGDIYLPKTYTHILLLSFSTLISFSSAPITAGDTLTGNVVLQVSSKAFNGEALRINVLGKELSAIAPNNTSHNKLLREESCFFRESQTLLRNFRVRRLRPAPCSYHPFQIQLPELLPSSVCYPYQSKHAGISKSGMQIQYTLTAQLGSLRHQVIIHCRSANLPSTPVPCLIQPASFPIQTLNLIPRGTVTVAASIKDSQVGRGQDVCVHLALHNQSTVNIDRVSIKLLEHVYWTTTDKNGRKHEDTTTIKLMKISDCPCQQQGVLVKQARSKTKRTPSEIERQGIYSALYRDICSGASTCTITIPQFTRDSHRGALIRVWHTLSIKLKTPTFSNSASISIGLKIGNRNRNYGLTESSHSENLPEMTPVSSASSSLMTTDSQTYTSSDADEGQMHCDTRNDNPQCHDRFPPSLADALQEVAKAEQTARIRSNASGQIPIISAAPIYADYIIAPGNEFVIVLDEDAIIPNESDLTNLVPLPPPNVVSIHSLLHRLASAFNPYLLLREILEHPEWRHLIEKGVDPELYGHIVALFQDHLQQIQIAKLLAPLVNGGHAFTEAFAVAAIRRSTEWNRINMAREVILLIDCFPSTGSLILNELSEWERMVLQSNLDDALARTRSY
jgi:hypothetical protein